MSNSNQNVRLPMHNEEWIKAAAVFVAELVRQGVTFEARSDTNANGAETMFVELTGGY